MLSAKQTAPVKSYLKQLNKKFSAGGSTEHSYRGDLQTLLNELVFGVTIINEPKRQEFGAPDYVINRDDVSIGYIEAKDIGTDLNKAEKSDQMERYLKSLDNLILSDYLEFRFYRYGEKVKEIKVGNASNEKLKSYPDTHSLFVDYLEEFCSFKGETIKSAEKLAKIMAQKARIMEEVLQKAIRTDYVDITLKDQYQAFKDILIHDLDEDTFADVYAQTITYGMFAARLHDPNLNTFSRYEAARLIPKTNPFLRNLFQYIAGYDLDDRIAWIVDALANVYRLTDVAALVKDLGDVTKNDPMIHFYETFLAEYDPKLRKKRGIWYTPEPVVNFIVRAVDDILKTEFNLNEGLADNTKTEIKVDIQGRKSKTEVHKVQILDPAAGTGTFLAEIVKLIYQKYRAQQGVWNDYVEKHLIPRLNGFELLMAPYAMAHLKLDLLLSETGYKPQKPQRLRIYLTNALEEHHPDTGTIFATWLSREANEANYVKRDTPVMVVLGNPPYSGHSANKGKWIEDLLKDYKQEPGGGKLKEKNPKWLNDDYVKFIRYGQYFIENNKEGILAFINNHSFLDNPTFRGMRWHLLSTFDMIYIVDLHGNAKKKEVCPDGSPDENVFDIQQGVSINIFVKTKKTGRKSLGKVFNYDLYGDREFKYNYLKENSIVNMLFEEVKQEGPLYFFTQKDFKVKKEYEIGFGINELFTINSVGIVTARDKFTISETKEELISRIEEFISLNNEEARSRFGLGKDARDWKVEFARKDLIQSGIDYNNIAKISYRPFDSRFTYFTGRSKGFHCMPRGNLMKHFLRGENIGLVASKRNRQVSTGYVFITKMITDFHILDNAQDSTSLFPVYCYPEDNSLLNEIGCPNRNPNLNMEIINLIADKLALRFTPVKEDTEGAFAPLDIFDYIYAILHSPTYREKYKEFLKIDFPRIPYPKDTDSFWKLVELGAELRQIHLLESPLVETHITTYPEDGSNEIEKIRYENSKIWINDKQYFDKVPETAWEFYIGGYQPAQKWLKDRKGRILGFDDVRHYKKIIVALMETGRLMHEIDLVVGDII